ncbi:ribosome silencing factor [Limnohabitans sp. Rim11]|jgi:ribosome-associated protein|uniref:ribosome silencing factor n=1 Tax=Limnohabitans sp. Rim11 TaxID=1100719 RepID=UPI000B09F2A1|nr:ribosome silencing factor [Limnohabitans sp. Rim11]
MTDTSAKKDTQKLQRAIVDALEDVKAQEIVVFDTEAMSPLFERVIIASGTSNRQTKALAASVRDKVREAGYPKPRIEGEDNGEWIIVDCGSAVAHIMQPTIRSYYNLEEIWGDKPVRLKLGAPKPVEPVRKPVAKKKANVSAGRTPTRRDAVPVGPMGSESAKPARKTSAKTSAKNGAKSVVKSGAKAAVKSTAKPAVKSTSKPASKSSSKPASKTASQAKPKAKAKPKA